MQEENRQKGDHRFTQIDTARLIIRRFQEADATPFMAMRNLKEVALYQGWSLPYSPSDTASFIKQMVSALPDVAGDWFQFALEERASGLFIGDIGIFPDNVGWGEVELGFSLHPAHQGKGLMAEALTALLDYLFNQRGKKRMQAIADVRNVPSWHLLERLGFVRERTLLPDLKGQPPSEAEYAYGLMAVNWHSRSTRG